MIVLYIALAVTYAIGFLAAVPIFYRWCRKGYDYGGGALGMENLMYNGSGAVGFALVWFISLPLHYHGRRKDSSNPSTV